MFFAWTLLLLLLLLLLLPLLRSAWYYKAVADPGGGANPAMAPPIQFGYRVWPPPLKKIKMVLKNGEYTCCYLFEMFASDMHQNEWFQVWFFKNFLGRGSPSPLPRPLPPFFLGLRPRFGLRPQFSGASRLRLGRFAPSIRAPPSTFGRRTWFGPPKINCWIRHCYKGSYDGRCFWVGRCDRWYGKSAAAPQKMNVWTAADVHGLYDAPAAASAAAASDAAKAATAPLLLPRTAAVAPYCPLLLLLLLPPLRNSPDVNPYR